MKFLFLFFCQITFNVLPQEEFQQLSTTLTNILPKTTNKKLKQVQVQFSQDPLQINLLIDDKQYALINEVRNREDNFMQIKFVQQDPDLVIFKAMSKMITDDNKLKNIKEIANFIKEDLQYVIENHEQEEQQYIDKVQLVIDQIELKLGDNKSKCETEINSQQQKTIYLCEDDFGSLLLLITINRIENHILINAQFNKSSNDVYFTINTEDNVIKEQLITILDNIQELEFAKEDLIQNTYDKLLQAMTPSKDRECEQEVISKKSKQQKFYRINIYCQLDNEDEQERKLNLEQNLKRSIKQINSIQNYDNKFLSKKVIFYEKKERQLLKGEQDFSDLDLQLIQYEFENATYIDIKYRYNNDILAEYSIPYSNAEQFDANINRIIKSFEKYVETYSKLKYEIKNNINKDIEGIFDKEELKTKLKNLFLEHKDKLNLKDIICEDQKVEKNNDQNDDDMDEQPIFFECKSDGEKLVTAQSSEDRMLFVFYMKKMINNKLQTITESYWLNSAKRQQLDEILKDAFEEYDDKLKIILLIQFEIKNILIKNKNEFNTSNEQRKQKRLC